MVSKYITEELNILLFPSVIRNFADDSEILCQPNASYLQDRTHTIGC